MTPHPVTYRRMHGNQLEALHTETLPLPPLPAGHLRIQMLTAGVCGTDHHIVNGQRPDVAEVLGHEGIGRVTDTTDPRFYPWLGRQVVFNPVNPTHPERVLGHSIPGVFTSVFDCPTTHIASGMLVPVPTGFPAHLGPLVEPLATAIYSLELLQQVTDLHHITILGGGPAGMLCALHALLVTSAHIQVLVHRPARQEQLNLRFADLGDRLQVTCTLPPDAPVADALVLCTPRQGAGDALQRALPHLRHGGCLDLFAGLPAGQLHVHGLHLQDTIRHHNTCGVPTQGRHETIGDGWWLTGHRGCSENHMQKSMQLLQQHPEVFQKLITHEIPLDRLPEHFRQPAHLNPPDTLKAVVHF